MYNYEVTRINRLDDVLIDTLFNFLKADCKAYADLDKELFNECDIYVCTSLRDPVKHIKGILGIRRTTMDKINIYKLEYYCQPNNILYSIEFIHVFDVYSYDMQKDTLKSMIGTSVNDKNDGFTFFVPKCPITNTDPVYYALEENNFKLYPYLENRNPVIMFMRAPKVGKNLNYTELK